MKQSKLDKLTKQPCPHCGHVGPPQIHYFGPNAKRATCSECGKTTRTFITFVDFFMVGVMGLIVMAWLFGTP